MLGRFTNQCLITLRKRNEQAKKGFGVDSGDTPLVSRPRQGVSREL